MSSHSELIVFYEVEVIYFENCQYKSRKHAYYPENEARQVYQRTLNKMIKNETSCLVCLRNAKHENIRQELLNYKVKKTK